MTITTRGRTRLVAAAIALVALAGCTHRIAGRVPRQWELRGAIVDASADHLRVRHKTGQVVDLLLDDRTDIVRNDQPAARDVLRPGARVRVVIEPLAEGRPRAHTIHVYGGGS